MTVVVARGGLRPDDVQLRVHDDEGGHAPRLRVTVKDSSVARLLRCLGANADQAVGLSQSQMQPHQAVFSMVLPCAVHVQEGSQHLQPELWQAHFAWVLPKALSAQ